MENKVVSERIEITLPAKMDYVSIARLTISGVAHRMGFSIDVLEDLKLCVSEACANSILHAYPESDCSFQTVTICCELYTDRLIIHVSDKGIQMDPTRLQLKRNTVPLHKENLTQGGLGLYLIETLMDSVEIYQQEGTTISMTKYVQQDEVKKSDRELSVREGK